MKMGGRKIKPTKDREILGHIFLNTFLKLPIFCEYCCEYIWGSGKRILTKKYFEIKERFDHFRHKNIFKRGPLRGP